MVGKAGENREDTLNDEPESAREKPNTQRITTNALEEIEDETPMSLPRQSPN